MESWEKASWVLNNCKFASSISKQAKINATYKLAFKAACHKADVKDVEGILKVASFFVSAIVHDITNPAVNTVSNPINTALDTIRPEIEQIFNKMKGNRGGQPLLTPDLNRIIALTFNKLIDVLRNKGINPTNKQNIRDIVQNTVEKMNAQQRDVSVALPKSQEFMGDRKTKDLGNLANQELNRLNFQPKFPAKKI